MRAFSLDIERPLAISKTDEIALLRKAVAAKPENILFRSNLAILLFVQDQFDEAIALLEQIMREAPGADTANLLAEAYISRETPEDDRRSEQAATQALALAQRSDHQSRALAALGKALTRQGQTDAARRTLLSALEANPRDINAYKRLANLDLQRDEPQAALATADGLLGEGVGHSRLFVARALALAKMGLMDEARTAVGLDRFLHREVLGPPAGWADVTAFNTAVRAELASHPDLRFNRYGAASTDTWRIDQPAFRHSVAIPQLQALIRHAVIDHVSRLDLHDAPWVALRPENAVLHNWCVLTDADGFEEWHVHQNGWLSGVYYIDVPPAVRTGDGREGCIVFGLPEDIVGDDAAAAYGETVVRPEPGLLLLFPSHTYHRTFAHGCDDRRICLAFDVQPC